MTKGLHFVLPVLVLLVCGLTPLTAAAEPITYTEAFTASGTVNGVPFDGAVTFTYSSDTTQVYLCGASIFCTAYGTASFSIQGIGAGAFTDPFYVFDNQGNAVAGFADLNVDDIVDLSNSAFATYDLKSAIGPLNSTYFYVHMGGLGSTLGIVIIDSTSGIPTFAAATQGTTPEPGSFVLFGSGLVGLATVIRCKLKI